MASLCKSRGMFLLLLVMVLAVAGCAANPPRSAAQYKALKSIRTTVPKLAGIPLKNAQTVLAFVALKVGEITFYDTDDPSLHGQVCDQDPAPGTPVRGGTPVHVTVYRLVRSKVETTQSEEK